MSLTRALLAACMLFSGITSAALHGIDATEIRLHAKAIVSELNQQSQDALSAYDLYRLTLAYDELSNKDAALSAANMGLQKATDPRIRYELLVAKASIYGRLFRDTRKAIEVLTEAEQQIAALTSAETNEVRSRLYETFAQAYNQLGDLTEAVRYARLSVDDAVRQHLPKQEVRSRLILGRIVLQQNNYAEAQRQLTQALQLATSNGMQAQIGSIALRLGMAYQKLGQYKDATTHFLLARDFYKTTNVNSQQVTIALNLADCYLHNADTAAAAHEIDLAQQLTTQLNDDPLLMAQVRYMQGMLAQANNDASNAESLMVRALQLYQQQGQLTMSAEVTMALVTQLIERNALDKANRYLSQVATPEQLPLYLQQQWYELNAQLRAREAAWHDAYQAQQKATELRFRWVQQQEKYKLDGLQEQLQQQPVPQVVKAPAETSQTWQLRLNVLLTVALVLMSITSVQLWRQRRLAPKKSSATVMLSWASFAKQLVQAHDNTPQVLLAVQMEHVSQRKHELGERRLRAFWQEFVQALPRELQDNYTIHTDTLWLHMPANQWASLLDPLQQTLHRIALRMPTRTGFHLFSAQLQPLMGYAWSADALLGIRELVWCSWQHLVTPGRIQHVHATSPTLTPVSWSAENVRQDIENAVQLGLLQLELIRDEPVELGR